ncbi:hypothetical protein BJP34_34605 [Moorena producens PAL-8-15-08-1]|uniref:Uncharacterized protein n=1 Tax=Moorena producens PAL-8-15-08-1 TaxID=1458985 RepID=A0A1D8U269_9CYAN|nr:hypothetical protein BJP34_34605 [Moorena producens PAL-8-15-08-1]
MQNKLSKNFVDIKKYQKTCRFKISCPAKFIPHLMRIRCGMNFAQSMYGIAIIYVLINKAENAGLSAI